MGRNIVFLKEPIVLDVRVDKDALDKHETTIVQFVNILKELDILLKDEPYTLGLDHKCEGVPRDHYHLRGWTKCTSSNIVSLRKKHELLKTDLRGNAHLMLKPKELEQDKFDEFFRYCIKDTLIYTQGFSDEWLKANQKIATEQYKHKLSKLVKQKDTRTLKEKLEEYLQDNVKSTQLEKYSQDNFDIVARKIVEFALSNNSPYYLRPNNIRDTTYMWLYKHGYSTADNIFDKLFGYGL